MVIGSAAFVSLQEDGFRDTPPPEVTVVPEEDIDIHDEPPDEEIEVGTVNTLEDAPSPSIIKVDPEAEPASSDNVIIIRDPSAIGQNLRVAHLPDRALVEESGFGPLPKRSTDGRRPFEVYARPWSGARGARVAIVIGGLGLSQTGTQSAIERLPEEVTLAFAPHGNSISRWMTTARRSGHEILLQIPMEPFDYPNINPGRNTLTVAAGDEKKPR